MNSPELDLIVDQKLSAIAFASIALRDLLNNQQNYAASEKLSVKVTCHWRKQATSNNRGIDMAKTLTATAKRILNVVKNDLSADEKPVAEPILADAHAEDLATVEPVVLVTAIKLTAKSLAVHSKGKSLVHVENIKSDAGDSVTIVSVVNDDMPFLFDSVLGQINDSADDVRMVVHPILDVAHAGKTFEVVDKSRPGLAREKTIRTSVIIAVLAPLSDNASEVLLKEIKSTLAQVNDAVRDWRPMQSKMDELVTTLKEGVTPARKSDVVEALEFLAWLRDDNFTFLGIREYDYVGGEKRGQLVRADAPALGILSDPKIRVMQRGDEQMTTTDEIRAFLNSRDVLIVTKANVRSVVHRRIHMDYIGVKKYDAKGKLSGEIRIVGLFTSAAYTRSVKRVPFIRSKAKSVIERSEYGADSHSGKVLLNILESYPRDELFQIDVPTLTRNANAILALSDRPRVRVLSRIDAFDRFVSIIIYVPRDRYSSEIRVNICEAMAQAYDGRVSAYYPAFPEGSLARVHVIIGRSDGETPQPTQASLERSVSDIIRTWTDKLRNEPNVDLDGLARFEFPGAYRDTVNTHQAVHDIKYMSDDRQPAHNAVTLPWLLRAQVR